MSDGQSIFKRCLNVFDEDTWNRDESLSENVHFKLLQDFYEDENAKSQETSDPYLNKIIKSIFLCFSKYTSLHTKEGRGLWFEHKPFGHHYTEILNIIFIQKKIRFLRNEKFRNRYMA